jgi:hypothetical protein
MLFEILILLNNRPNPTLTASKGYAFHFEKEQTRSFKGIAIKNYLRLLLHYDSATIIDISDFRIIVNLIM